MRAFIASDFFEEEVLTLGQQAMEAREHPITQPVCVTGATGFIGGHIVEELLKAKYHVRATVRSKHNVEKLHHLALLIEKYCSHFQYDSSEGPSLTLYEADLLEDDSFDAAIEGTMPYFPTKFLSYHDTCGQVAGV